MGRPTTDEATSRAAQSALLNLPKWANAKAKQHHHHSIVVRKRIEYSSRYATCLRSWHLLGDQSCQQRATQNSNILTCLLSGFKSTIFNGGARPRRAPKIRVRPLKPTSAFYADTFFTCTFLLLVSLAILSQLLCLEAASGSAIGNHHQHLLHSHNEIIHRPVYLHLGRHGQQQHNHQHKTGSKRRPAHGGDSQRDPVASEHWHAKSERDAKRPSSSPDQPSKRDPSPRAAQPLERDLQKQHHFQQHHSDHPNKLELKPERRSRLDGSTHRQHLVRFRGFATPRRPTSSNHSEPNLALESGNEFDSYNVNDVSKDDDDNDEDDEDDDDDDDDNDAQTDDLDDSDGQLGDEDEEDGVANEIDLDAGDRKWLHFNQRHAVPQQQKYQPQLQLDANKIEPHQTEHRKRGASRPVEASRRQFELPKPRVPYQTPIVVSISDNSFVSASPVVLTTGGGSSADAFEEIATSNQRQLTTSTTATTTREAFIGLEELQRSSSELGLDLEDEVGRGTQSTRPTSGAAVVLGTLKRYNYIVSDLERPRGPASERRNQKQAQQLNRLKPSASLEVQLPRRRSRTMQTSEPNVDLAPTVGTLSVLAAEPDDDNLDAHEAGDGIGSLEEVDDDDDDDDYVDTDGDRDENDENHHLDQQGGGQYDAGQEVETEARFARASQQLDEFVRKSLDGAQPTSGKYSHLIVGARNELPSYGRRHLASIRMIQGDPNEYKQGGALNGAIIAILFGIGVTGVLVLIVGVKMRSIRERIAHKGRRRSLVPDTDFLINTIPT